jgi:hypothetical protein
LPAPTFTYTMAKVHFREIPLTPRAFEDGSGWYVEAYWIGRLTERLGRFAIYSEDHDWIALESAAYFVLRELDSRSTTVRESQLKDSLRGGRRPRN